MKKGETVVSARPLAAYLMLVFVGFIVCAPAHGVYGEKNAELVNRNTPAWIWETHTESDATDLLSK